MMTSTMAACAAASAHVVISERPLATTSLGRPCPSWRMAPPARAAVSATARRSGRSGTAGTVLRGSHGARTARRSVGAGLQHLLAPDGQANVIASSEPLDPSIDTEQYATVQGDLLRGEFPGYVEHAFEEAALLGGRRGYRRHFEWTPPDGVAVTQIQLYFAENSRGYTATATTPSTNFENVEAELRQILAGLLI